MTAKRKGSKGQFRDRELAAAAGKKGGERSAAMRAATRGPWSGNILTLMDAAGMVGEEWMPWRAWWKACYALTMSDDELRIFQRHTGRENPPAEPVAEAFMVVGRGGGKTRNAALHAFYRAITFDSSKVAPNEDVVIPLLASDRRQARAGLEYIRGFHALEVAAPYVHRGELSSLIEYKTSAKIEVVTASKSAPRGFTCPSANADEIAFWRSDIDGSNNDTEVLTAVRGSLGRIRGSLLLVLSNPAAPRGELFDAVQQYHGVEDPDVLVWVADTLSMNPTYDTRLIARAFKKDPVIAMSEFGMDGQVVFRQHSQALLDREPLEAVIVGERYELPRTAGVRHVAFIDAAQGARSGDSFTLAISHAEGGKSVLDCIVEKKPPFNPLSLLIEEFVPIINRYGIGVVVGDQVSSGFVEATLRACGLRFEPVGKSKSDLYLQLLNLINSGACELLDVPTLRLQLLGLQRFSTTGKDRIDHVRNAHDDLANAVAGSVVLASSLTSAPKPRAMFRAGADTHSTVAGHTHEQSQHQKLAAFANRTLKTLERRDARDRALEEASENEPVTRAVWRLNGSK